MTKKQVHKWLIDRGLGNQKSNTSIEQKVFAWDTVAAFCERQGMTKWSRVSLLEEVVQFINGSQVDFPPLAITDADDVSEMGVTVEDIITINRLLAVAFKWDASGEGHEYWADVANRLDNIVRLYNAATPPPRKHRKERRS